MIHKSIAEFFEQAIKLESGQMSGQEMIEFFQWLLSTGVIWSIPQWQPAMAEMLKLGKLRVN